MGKITDNDLQDFIDGRLSEDERKEISREIEKDSILKSSYEALLEVHKNLEQVSLHKVPEDFSSRVMANLYNAKYKSVSYFQKRNLLTFLSILIGVVIGIYILSSSMANISFFENINISPIGLQEQQLDLNPYLNLFTSDFFLKAFLFFDLILALFLLDVAVLKPYFRNRRKVSY